MGMSEHETMSLNSVALSELFELEVSTGDLFFKPRGRHWFKSDRMHEQWNTKFAGKKANRICKKHERYHYMAVSLSGKDYRAHRVTGVLLGMLSEYHDEREIDHIDGNPLNNCPENLRPVSRFVNSRNLGISKANTSGVMGVYFSRKMNKWCAGLGAGGKNNNIYLGVYSDFFEAICARKSAEIKYGYFKNHGVRSVAKAIEYAGDRL